MEIKITNNFKITKNKLLKKLNKSSSFKQFLEDFLLLSNKNNWTYLERKYDKELLEDNVIEIIKILLKNNIINNDFTHFIRNGHILIECYEEENLNTKYLGFIFNISY